MYRHSPYSKVQIVSLIVFASYLMKDIDVIVLRGERGVAVLDLVNHAAAGDDYGSKPCADAVFKSRRLSVQKGAIQRVVRQCDTKYKEIYSPSVLLLETLHTAPE